ncbi:MAG: outer membrane protein assembly factor BamD [Pseudomonadota bacterium]|nr:outer membrane protein assembly factor BamD [Pseudomonadota bacterium]
MNFRIALVMIALVTPLLASCASMQKNASDEAPEIAPETLYTTAADLLDAKKFKPAAEAFDEVERQHPYSVWATRAQLMAAYAHYEALDYDDAVLALNRFLQLHPGHEDAEYARYLQALCYYEQISDIHRDQEMTRKALDALHDVIRRAPDSEYAKDAAIKIDLTNDHLAGKEMSVGRWYQRRAHYQAAIERFRNVLIAFETTSHASESLYRLTECYLALGLTGEAQKTAAVLGHNYPGSDWYEDAYKLVGGEEQGEEPVEEDNKSWWPF